MEQFESFLVESETIRLRTKFGSQNCSEDQQIINKKLETFSLALENGALCQGTCSSRSACPTHICRSPRTVRSFNIFRSHRSPASSDASVKRRKSIASQPSLRKGADKIRGEIFSKQNCIHHLIFAERRNEVKSWPPAACTLTSPTHEQVQDSDKKSEAKFWKKLLSSWGGFIGRENGDEPSAIGPGVLACATCGGGWKRSWPLFSPTFFLLFSTPSVFDPLRGNSCV